MNIIVIEDDDITAKLISEIVEPLGEVTVAHTIVDAIREIDAAPEGSLMLWDLRLGDSTAENTATVIKAVKENDPKAKMVVVSGMINIPETGAESVVTKGSSMNFSRDLYRAIRKALSGHEGYEQNVELLERLAEEKGMPLDTPPHPA